MAYSDFSLAQAVRQFGLTVGTHADLFSHIPPVPATPTIAEYIRLNLPLALLLHREKPRSELLVAPLLAEVWRQSNYQVSHYSGVDFNVEPAEGLNGFADFLFTRGPQLPDVSPPVLVVVEGKKEDIQSGYGQCAAEMVAALRLNRREKTGVETVFGCITIGDNWKFLRLDESLLRIDRLEYLISDLDTILGILLYMVGHHPQQAALAA